MAYETTQIDHINTLHRKGLLESELFEMFEIIRCKGNHVASSLTRLAFSVKVTK